MGVADASAARRRSGFGTGTGCRRCGLRCCRRTSDRCHRHCQREQRGRYDNQLRGQVPPERGRQRDAGLLLRRLCDRRAESTGGREFHAHHPAGRFETGGRDRRRGLRNQAQGWCECCREQHQQRRYRAFDLFDDRRRHRRQDRRYHRPPKIRRAGSQCEPSDPQHGCAAVRHRRYHDRCGVVQQPRHQ